MGIDRLLVWYCTCVRWDHVWRRYIWGRANGFGNINRVWVSPSLQQTGPESQLPSASFSLSFLHPKYFCSSISLASVSLHFHALVQTHLDFPQHGSSNEFIHSLHASLLLLPFTTSLHPSLGSDRAMHAGRLWWILAAIVCQTSIIQQRNSHALSRIIAV